VHEYVKLINKTNVILNKMLLKNMKRIYKKYVELINLAENANGRKEVVSLLKKAAKLKSISESKTAA